MKLRTDVPAGDFGHPALFRRQEGRTNDGARGTRLKSNLWALLFLAPWLVGLLGLTLGPMIASLYYSFTSYALLSPPKWAGLENYLTMLGDGRFHDALKVTFLYVVMSVPAEMVFALLVALVLNKGLRGLGAYRAIYYVPSLVGGSVAIAILWLEIFGSNGVINHLLSLVGVRGPGWVSSPDTSLVTLVILRVWQFGAPMVIYLAGLKQIPEELYEASRVDGANAWRRFWSVTVPLLSPVIFFNLVLQIIGSFQAFTPAFIVSGGSGGPSDSTLFYALYLYQEAFQYFRMGYASAMAWVLLVIIAAFTGINFLASRYWVFYADADEGGRR